MADILTDMKLRVLLFVLVFVVLAQPLHAASLDVPFTSQAPFGDWGDMRQQEGCEEASVLMAMHWVKGTPLTKELALKEIIELSEFQKKKYGYFENTSAQTTMSWAKEYFKYDGFELSSGVTVESIKKALDAGKVVIIPTNGQKLGNPNFTPPGPVHHMLVVIGYDEKTKDFITNDPGTRKGEGYRYKYEMLVRAVRDYADGAKHIKDDSRGEKKMILVSKEVPKSIVKVHTPVVSKPVVVPKEPSALAMTLWGVFWLFL